ncbi:MAG: outer membrane protein assembly factor BamB [Xanthomonadales bacterium]|nr:outer membrane protein assembly factor BamB [Xanthomonadales bacterium]
MSRSVLRLTLLAVLAGTLLQTGCDSFKSSKDNVDPPTELVDLTSARSVNRLWSAKAGPGAARQGGRLAPAVADGTVYVASVEGTLSAFDASSGRLRWKIDTEQPLAGGPAAADGLVVVGSLEGQLLAFDTEGNPRWDAQLSSEVIGAPAIARGMVVAQANDGRTYAFDQDSGEARWLLDRAVPTLSLRGTATPLIGEGSTFIGQANGKLTAVANLDGGVEWEYAVGTADGRNDLERMVDVDGRMLLIQGDLYAIGYGAQVAALASESGRVLWSRDMSSYSGLDLAGSSLFTTTSDGEVLGMATRSGSVLWKQEALKFRFLSTPVVHGSLLAVGDYEGYVHWLDQESGEIVARARAGKKGIRSAPRVVDDVLYVLDLDGTLSAFAAPGG